MTPINTDQEKAGKHDDLTQSIIGVFYEVYNELGFGFVESLYSSAMRMALAQAGMRVQVEVPLSVQFRGEVIGVFKADLIVNERVLIELKTCEVLMKTHCSQTLNYLKATKIEVALLMNFGPTPTFKRFVLDNGKKVPRSVSSVCIGVKPFVGGGTEWV